MEGVGNETLKKKMDGGELGLGGAGNVLERDIDQPQEYRLGPEAYKLYSVKDSDNQRGEKGKVGEIHEKIFQREGGGIFLLLPVILKTRGGDKKKQDRENLGDTSSPKR